VCSVCGLKCVYIARSAVQYRVCVCRELQQYVGVMYRSSVFLR